MRERERERETYIIEGGRDGRIDGRLRPLVCIRDFHTPLSPTSLSLSLSALSL